MTSPKPRGSAFDRWWRSECPAGEGPDVRDVARIHAEEGWNAALAAAVEKIRSTCGPCGGDGVYPNGTETGVECEYCGRPTAAIQSLRPEEVP